MMVMEDSNTRPILATGIKSRKKEHLITGFITMCKTLKKVGINPIIHRIDKEFQKDLIEEIEAQGLEYQITPPRDHRTLPAKRSIQTFKNYFKSILYGCDPGYPKNQWDQLIDVVILTLNMMKPFCINPKKSVYNEIWGNFDFNKTPLAQPGYLIVTHERPQDKALGQTMV